MLPREDPTPGGEAALLELERGEFPAGERATWEEAPTALPDGALATWRALDAGHGYLHVRVWAAGHVTVVGQRSGGGSGRPRALRLLTGWTLTVSTALTFDRTGRCVEGAGIPVDAEAAGTDDEVLAVALAL